jgi:hypothetical protein
MHSLAKMEMGVNRDLDCIRREESGEAVPNKEREP